MINDILLYAGSILLVIWGIAHIVPTKSVVSGFGEISEESKRIITMEWVAEGLTLCFIGALVLIITIFEGSQYAVSNIVYRASAAMLLIMAVWTLSTGARTSIVPIKICPIVKTIVAVIYLLGSIVNY
jgi:hypothetical protein